MSKQASPHRGARSRPWGPARILGRKGRTIAVIAALCAVGTATATVVGGADQSDSSSRADSNAARRSTPVVEPVAQADLPPPPGLTERVSSGADGRQGDAASGGVTDLLASANGNQAISADGRWVAFASAASNLIQGTAHPAGGLFLRDRQSGGTVAVPWIDGGPFPPGIVAAEPALSSDGAVVAFTAIVTPEATPGRLVGRATTPFVLAWDAQTNRTEIVSVDANARPIPGFQPSISGDGRYVAFTAWSVRSAPPILSNLMTDGFPFGGQYYIYGPSAPCTPQEATISVTATDPDDAVTAVTLSYQPTAGGVLQTPMTPVGGNVWQATIVAQDAWAVGRITYSVQARDAAGNLSSPLGNTGAFILNKGDCIL